MLSYYKEIDNLSLFYATNADKNKRIKIYQVQYLRSIR